MADKYGPVMRLLPIKAIVGIGLLVSTLACNALTINDSAYLGSWTGQDAASLASEKGNINFLIDLDPGSTASAGNKKNKVTVFQRSWNFEDTALPDAISSGGREFEGCNIPSIINATGFSYLTAKYGNFTAVWYLGGLGDLSNLNVPWNIRHDLSNVKLLGPTAPKSVPDAGMTAMLLGIGLSGVALIRRKF